MLSVSFGFLGSWHLGRGGSIAVIFSNLIGPLPFSHKSGLPISVAGTVWIIDLRTGCLRFPAPSAGVSIRHIIGIHIALESSVSKRSSEDHLRLYSRDRITTSKRI